MAIDQVALTLRLLSTFSAGDVASVKEILSINGDDTLAVGDALDKANQIWSDRLALAGSPQTIDLTSLTSEAGRSVSFSRIKGVYVKNTSTTSTHIVVVGNATNPINLFGTSTHTVSVRPNGILMIWAPDATGWAVTGGSADEIKFNPGADTFNVDVALIGCS